MPSDAELREMLARATPGPWELQDGCSWRRIGALGHDGNVLCPSTYSRDDRHPDLTAGKGEDLYANLELIVAAVNSLPALLTRIEVLEKGARTLIAKLDECAPGIDDAFLHREMRCGPYEGPNYAAELAALRSVVEGEVS